MKFSLSPLKPGEAQQPLTYIKSLDTVIGRAVFRAVQRHFRELDAQRHRPGHSRHYYGAAAKGVFNPSASAVEAGTAYTTALGYPAVVVNHVGITQRILGGDIVPKNAKMLAIGAKEHPETWDKSPTEFVGLKLRWGKDRTGTVRPIAWARDESTGLPVERRVAGDKWKRSRKGSTAGGKWDVFFWLTYRVTQRPDPSVAPDVATLEREGYAAAELYLRKRHLL